MQRITLLATRRLPLLASRATAFTPPSMATAMTRPTVGAVSFALHTHVRFKSCVASQYTSENSASQGTDVSLSSAPTPSPSSSPEFSASASGKGKVTYYSKLGMDGFTDVKFNTAADTFLEHVEGVIDSLDNVEVEDVNCNGGVLTLETSTHGTFILNKQAPNVQLWLSSPVSGPHHYDMVLRGGEKEEESETAWLCDHDGHDLQERLEQELSQVLGVPVKL